MTESKSFAKNTVLIAISKFSNQLLLFFMLPFYTTWLSVDEYGLVDLIVTYGSLFAPLVLLNMEMAVFRHLVDERQSRSGQTRIITNAVEITAAVSMLAVATLALLSTILDPYLVGAMAVYFFSSGFASLILNIARGLGRVKAFAVVGIGQGLIGVVANVILIYYLHLGAIGMLLGLSIAAVASSAVLAVVLALPSKIKKSARDRGTKKQLIRYSLPLIPNSISWWAFNASDRTIISLVISVASNGIYAVSNKFSGVLSSLWGVFYLSWSETAATNINKPNNEKLFSYIANVSVAVFGGLAIVGIAATSVFFPFMVNNSFHEALLYVPVLMLASLLNSVVGYYSAIYIAKKMTREVMHTSVTAAIINVIGTISLIWFIDIWAAAISTAVAYGVMAIYRHYDIKKYIAISYERGLFAKVFGAYTLVASLYYIVYFVPHLYWINYINVAIAAVIAYILNRQFVIKMVKYGWDILHRRDR